jgi:putative ABC transport system permease protein
MISWQLVREGIAVGFRSLRAHKLRTFLATLGVAIGIFAITLIFTLVNSLTFSITKNLSELGNRVFFVHQFSWTNADGGDWMQQIKRPQMSFEDFEKLEAGLNDIDGVCFEADLNTMTIHYKGQGLEGVGVNGITERYSDINDFKYAEGRPLTNQEMDAGRPVAIIGAGIAETFFGDAEQAIGKEVRLHGKTVRIQGVLVKTGKDLFGQSKDEAMYIPYKLAARLFNVKGRMVDKVVMVKARSEEDVDRVETEVVGLMRASRRLKPVTPANFSINKPEMLMKEVSSISNYLKIGGVIISIFSIIVGGFGIGNIMYTVVKERTFEIGVQKSLGATRGFIVFQFLSEAVMLCLLGGIVGLLMQVLAAKGGQLLLNQLEVGFTIVISWSSVVFGILLSVFIGITSGVMPSLAAARLDPVDAMRSR